MNTESTEITLVPEYTPTVQALAELNARLKGVVYDVTSGKGMDMAKKDRAEVRTLRTDLEKERVRIKAPALERCRLIDAEAKSLTAALLELEQPIDAQIKAEEQRKEREKAAKEEAERQRIAAINARFDAVKGFPLKAVNKTYTEIEALIEELEATDEEGFDEDAMKAAFVYEKRMAKAQLRAALDARWLADKEAEKIAAERAELEELRRIAAEQQAELDRQAEAQRQREAEEARRAEEAARAEREAAEAAERAKRKAEQDAADKARAEQQAKEDAERKAAAEALRQKEKALAEEQAKLKAEREAATKKAKADAIAAATLTSAAAEALELLNSLGQSEHLTTQKLAAALAKENDRD